MEVVVDRGKDGDIDSWKEVQLIYNSALKQISTKLEILNVQSDRTYQVAYQDAGEHCEEAEKARL